MKILILGASGFIGTRLSNRLQKNNQVTRLDRTTTLNEIKNYNNKFDYTINCISSSLGAPKSISCTSNYDVPRLVRTTVQSEIWLQIDSYLQLQIPFGRRDPYTLDKQNFCNFLDNASPEQSKVAVKHLTLPHIFGEGDRRGRLISSAIKELAMNNNFYASLGSQYLPILHIEDALDGIIKFMDSEQASASCPPFWNGQVYKLLAMIQSAIGKGHVIHDKEVKSIDSDFPKISFDKGLSDWVPQMQLDEFLIWISKQADKFSN